VSGYEKSPDYGSGNDPKLERKVRRWSIGTVVVLLALFVLLMVTR
jgi:hypothetical protein